MKRLFLCPSLVDLFGVIVVIAVVFRPMMGDPGVGWHLRAGEWIAHHGYVPSVDPFLAGPPRPWIHNQWLSDLLFWRIYEFGGWLLLDFSAKALIVAAIVFLLAPLLRERGSSEPATFLVVALVTLLVGTQWILRPVIISFFFFAVLYVLLFRRHLLLIGPLFLVWANMHSGFAMGAVLLGVFWVAALAERDRVWLRSLTILGLCSLLATFISPYRWRIHLNALALLADEFFMNLNAEWLAPDFWTPFFAPLAVATLLLVMLAGRAPPLNILNLLLVVVFLPLALYSRRYIPFLGIAVALPLAELLKYLSLDRVRALPQCWKQPRSGVPYTGCALALFCAFSPLRSDAHLTPEPFFPAAAVTALLERGPESGIRLFHTPNWGGYLALRLWPALRPTIDDRNELNGRAAYEDFLALNGAHSTWREILRRQQFNYLLLEADAPLRLVIERDASWELVFKDEKALLYALRPNN